MVISYDLKQIPIIIYIYIYIFSPWFSSYFCSSFPTTRSFNSIQMERRKDEGGEFNGFNETLMLVFRGLAWRRRTPHRAEVAGAVEVAEAKRRPRRLQAPPPPPRNSRRTRPIRCSIQLRSSAVSQFFFPPFFPPLPPTLAPRVSFLFLLIISSVETHNFFHSVREIYIFFKTEGFLNRIDSLINFDYFVTCTFF